jgi:Tfp pilus assembly protein PilE
LVVVAIISILASIAVAQYAVYKQHAVDSLMESTLQAGRHAMEAYFVDHDTYATASIPTLTSSYGFRQSDRVTLFTIADQQQLTFKIHVCANGGSSPGMEFDSTVGVSTSLGSCS